MAGLFGGGVPGLCGLTLPPFKFKWFSPDGFATLGNFAGGGPSSRSIISTWLLPGPPPPPGSPLLEATLLPGIVILKLLSECCWPNCWPTLTILPIFATSGVCQLLLGLCCC